MKRQIKIFLLLGILLSSVSAARAQVVVEEAEEMVTECETPQDATEAAPESYTLSGSEKKLIAERIAAWNTEWDKVVLNGKLNVDGLPIKPTVKIFMENNKKLQISVRAPFLGEVARIEATRGEVIAVNKIKKTYWKADPSSILEEDPTLVSELQALFLGRVTIVGHGEFKADQVNDVEIIQQEANEFLVIPNDIQAEGALNFGYSVGSDGRLEEMIGVYSGFSGYANLSYARSGERLQIRGELVGAKRTSKATLEFDAPEWGAKGFDKIKNLSDYRQVSFSEVLKLN